MRVPDFIVYPVGLAAVALAALTYWALTIVEGRLAYDPKRSALLDDLADYKRR